MPSLNQFQIRRFSIPANHHLPEHMHAQAAELVALRMRSEDAGDATKAAKAAVAKAITEDSLRLRKVAADPKATPADLKKAATAHAEGDARLVLARTERTERAVVDVQTRAENRWAGSMRRSAAEQVEITQGLEEATAQPLRKAGAAIIALRSTYMSHVQANSLARDLLSPNEHINIAPSTWRPSTKSVVRWAPGGVSDTLDLSKLAPALKADSNRHVRPEPKASDVERQGGEAVAAMAEGHT